MSLDETKQAAMPVLTKQRFMTIIIIVAIAVVVIAPFILGNNDNTGFRDNKFHQL